MSSLYLPDQQRSGNLAKISRYLTSVFTNVEGSCSSFLKIFELYKLDTFFRQIKSFLRFCLAFVFGLQTYYLIDFSKIYRLKGLEPKNKG